MKIKPIIWLTAIFISTLPTYAKPTEHTCHHYLKIQIHGIDNKAARKNIRLALKEDKRNLTTCENPTEDFLNQHIIKITTEALEPYGYFSAQIKETHQSSPQLTTIALNIQPGPITRITRVHTPFSTITPLPPIIYQKIKQAIVVKTGQPFNFSQYETSKQNLLQLASEYGYLNASVNKSKVIIDTDKAAATITLAIQFGLRYRFGQTHFDQSYYHTAFLKRFLTYKPHKFYNQSKLNQTRSGLIQSNHFQQINLNASIKKNQQEVPVTLKLTPMPYRSYAIGAGYGTDTGPRGLFKINFNRLNSFGHQLNFLIRESRINNALLLHYIIPGYYPPTDYYTLFIEKNNIDQKIGTANSNKIGISSNNKINPFLLKTSINFLKEKYRIKNNPQTNTKLIYPEIAIERTFQNKKSNPDYGYQINAAITGASKNLYSETNFWQLKIKSKWLLSLREKTHLVLRGEFAHTEIKNLIQLPLSLQLLAGGAHSIRGYSYNSIGPGRNKIIGSIEIQQAIANHWELGYFIDTGSVTNDSWPSKWNIGTGPALIWSSHLGFIEISFAYAINNTDSPWMVQLQVGSRL